MINEFQGEHRFLSNFYPARVTWMGHVYPTVEHAFQAAKFAAYPDVVKEIQEAESPGQTKKIARKHSQLVPAEWTIFTRELVMMYLLQQKFAKGTAMGDKLVATGDDQLIEGNTWGDTFWGVCNGKGENTLGQMLMIIRAQIR